MVNNVKVELESRDNEYFKGKEIMFSLDKDFMSNEENVKGKIIHVTDHGFLVNITESFYIEGLYFIPFSAGICFKIL